MPPPPTDRLASWAARQLGRAAIRGARELGELVPVESRVHLLKAQRELFLAAKGVVDHRRHAADPDHRPKARKISVD
ncbi:MAG: hypothetical protein ACREOD_08575 [Candidatus Dormibacteria bacterium]